MRRPILILLFCALAVFPTASLLYRKHSVEGLLKHGNPVAADDLEAVMHAIQQIGPKGNLDNLAMEDHPLKKRQFDPGTLRILISDKKSYGIQVYESPGNPKAWDNLGTVDDVEVTRIPGSKAAIGEKKFETLVGEKRVEILWKWQLDPTAMAPAN